MKSATVCALQIRLDIEFDLQEAHWPFRWF